MLRCDSTRTRPGVGRLLAAAIILCASAGLRAARADNIVLDWNNEFLTVVQQTSISWVDGPPEVAREMAIFGNAMAGAVSAAPGGGASANIAAATAAYSALSSIFNDAAWQTPASTPTGGATPASTLANSIVLPELQSFLGTELANAGISPAFSSTTLQPLACGASPTAACLGYNLGIGAAATVTSGVANDGAIAAIQNGLAMSNAPASGPNLQPGTPKITPGVYVPPATRPEMYPAWGSVTPMLATPAQLAGAQATVSGPPPISSRAYADALLETECEGSGAPIGSLPASVQSACAAAGYTQETTAAANAALFWNDPGGTIQPPGHWLQIADTAMQSQNSSLLQSAQLTALLGDAEDDAGIAAWGIKYKYNLWRPVTAIQDCPAGQTSGAVAWNAYFTSCDSTWTSLIATPPHPDYIAGHPAFSGAAATVLADFFGTDNIAFSSTSNYYCNGGTPGYVDALVVSCTAAGTTWSICTAGTPNFSGGVAISCTGGGVVNQAACADIVNGINTNGSPLICPITETFDSFTDASNGPNGAEFSRVVGGIHTPFAVEDALTVGNAIGAAIAADAGLPDVLPEPSSLSMYAIALLALTCLRRAARTR